MLNVRQQLVSQMRRPLPEMCRLPKGYRLEVTYSGTRCRNCEGDLKVGWTGERSPVGIKLGEPQVRKHTKVCKRCGQIHHCRALEALVPSCGRYCYDMIMAVGQWYWREDVRVEMIQQRLEQLYRLDVPESTITDLANKFLDYLLAFHRSQQQQIARYMKHSGGYVCHIDGTCEAGTPTIFMAMDGGSKIVLETRKMRAETTSQIQKLLESCDQAYGEPLASVSDLSSQIAKALSRVWPNIPHLLCQYHFLRRLGEKLFDRLHRKLTKGLRRCKIAASQRQMRKDLIRSSKGKPPIDSEQLEQYLTHSGGIADRADIAHMRRYIAYALLLWVRDHPADLEGKHYPFDLPSLAFYRRCKQMQETLEEMFSAARTGPEQVKTIGTMLRHLRPVSEDEELVEVAGQLTAARKLFDRLRAILRLDFFGSAQQPSTKGANPAEQGELVEQELEAYREKLREIVDGGKDTARSQAAEKILRYLDRYWSKLIGHHFTTQTPEGEVTIKVFRTNNVAEMLFGEDKRHLRRRMGIANLKRAVATARPERLLVSNLNREVYVNLLLDGSVENLVSHFPSCDEEAKKIRQRRRNRRTDKAIPLRARDIRDEDFLDKVTEGAELLVANTAARERAA